MPGILKRAVSSPNVRSVASNESMALSAADKKRNKLGYHRTAVACGHCRRRKIRCIPAFEDTTGRCQNCIRLKKDCHFYPVDQQMPGAVKRGRSGSKADAFINEGERSVSSSSPGVLGSSSVEQIDQVNGQIGTPPLPQESPGFPPYAVTGGPVGQHIFDYHHPQEHPPHHLSHYPSHPGHPGHVYHGDRAHFDGHAPPYFHPPEPQVLQSSYSTSPYSSTPLSGTMTTTPQENSFQFPQQSPGSDFAWAPHAPTRSMSIADTEDLTNNFAAYRANTFPSFHQRMSAPETPHLPSNTASVVPMGPDGHSMPVTMAGGYHDPVVPYHLPHQGPGNWGPPMVGHGPPMPLPSGEAYHPSWTYQTGPGLAGVREEDDPHHMVHAQMSLHKPFRPIPG